MKQKHSCSVEHSTLGVAFLATARLLLRRFHPDDLDRFAELFTNSGFVRFSVSHGLSREETKALIEKVISWDQARLPSQFVLVESASDIVIGYCGFFHQEVDGNKEVEIGYRLHPDWWNRGLATEAARAVSDHAFRDWKPERVISLIHPDNIASRRVAEKNGMTLERETTFKGYTILVFALHRSQWRESVAR